MNNVQLIGNLVRDAELTFTKKWKNGSKIYYCC